MSDLPKKVQAVYARYEAEIARLREQLAARCSCRIKGGKYEPLDFAGTAVSSGECVYHQQIREGLEAKLAEAERLAHSTADEGNAVSYSLGYEAGKKAAEAQVRELVAALEGFMSALEWHEDVEEWKDFCCGCVFTEEARAARAALEAHKKAAGD